MSKFKKASAMRDLVAGMTRRKFGFIAACVVPLAVLSHSAAANEVVRFGSLGGLTDAGVYLADELGFFKEEGIDLKTMRMANAPALVAALATDQLDVSGLALTPGLFAAQRQGIALRLVGDKQSFRPGFAATRLVVRSDLLKATPRESIQGLRGKIVAVSSKGSTSYANAIRMLKEAGVEPSEVKWKELKFGSMATALSSRAIDAAYLIEPYLTKLIMAGTCKDVSNVGKLGEKGASRLAVPIVYSETFAQKKKEAQGFMNAYMRGVRVYNDAVIKGKDKEKVYEILARRAGVDLTVVRNAFPAGLDPDQEVNLDTIKEIEQFYIDQGFLKEKADLSKLVDTSFAEAAVKKFGHYQY
jgi:NitT/TauT family transport system substrate-binding protein